MGGGHVTPNELQKKKKKKKKKTVEIAPTVSTLPEATTLLQQFIKIKHKEKLPPNRDWTTAMSSAWSNSGIT